MALFGLGCAAMLAASPRLAAQECVAVGAWAAPVEGRIRSLGWKEVLEQAAARAVVLLGELHDRAEHHRWQLQMMAALRARRADMVLGFEMFPRRVQPVLNRWVAGELSEAQFLRESDWARVWGFETEHYLPLFHFARMNRIPMVALNVERSLIREIGRKGADALAESAREGVGRPQPASAEYLRDLHSVYVEHATASPGAGLEDPGFLRFVDGQLMWDRAMAEAIRGARERHPGHQVVAVMGRGHTGRHAVPQQLRTLGIADVMVLLPWERDAACKRLQPGIADALFGVESERAEGASERPRLGVVLGGGDGAAVRIDRVAEGSVAAQAGLRAGDVVVAIAGTDVRASADVIAAVARQAPGTWLPLRVRRDGTEIELVAKFPARPS
ncbi:MAG: ChaN family lipoprotein [Burkholderiales bacterium]|nr:ChaN family lipoprotein [Burkholderiales bacterium]